MTALNPDKLVQYGDYVLENVMSCSANFTNIDEAYSDIPDADGSFDEQLSGRARMVKGTVTASLMLTADLQEVMRRKKDNLLAMLGKGPRPLWYLPETPKLGPRWCRARVSKISLDEKADDYNRMQEVQITWSVAYPRWFSRPHVNYLGELNFSGAGVLVDQESYYLGFNAQLDAGQFLTVPRVAAQVKNGDIFQVVNLGNAPTQVLCQVAASRPWTLGEGLHYGDPGVFIGGYGSTSLSNLAVTRKDSVGNTVDKFNWTGTLGINERLEVNSSTGKVTQFLWPNFNQSGFGNFVVQSGIGFLMLDPGINTIKVEGVFNGPFGHIFLDWDDAWF